LSSSEILARNPLARFRDLPYSQSRLLHKKDWSSTASNDHGPTSKTICLEDYDMLIWGTTHNCHGQWVQIHQQRV